MLIHMATDRMRLSDIEAKILDLQRSLKAFAYREEGHTGTAPFLQVPGPHVAERNCVRNLRTSTTTLPPGPHLPLAAWNSPAHFPDPYLSQMARSSVDHPGTMESHWVNRNSLAKRPTGPQMRGLDEQVRVFASFHLYRRWPGPSFAHGVSGNLLSPCALGALNTQGLPSHPPPD
ncbi:hypothetical protein B0H12DRAFT_1110988 [Mycena haematopus]|nr:hypothetical protein B0H12DRAFT_1110988 [Mycena haematopus]